jgi:hypothetical protein
MQQSAVLGRGSKIGIDANPQKLLSSLEEECSLSPEALSVLMLGLTEVKPKKKIQYDIVFLHNLGFHEGLTVKDLCRKQNGVNLSCTPYVALVVLKHYQKKLVQEDGWVTLIVDKQHILLLGHDAVDNGIIKKVRCYMNASDTFLHIRSKLIVFQN